MRYSPEHKAEVHQRIIRNASRRIRAEWLTGAGVGAVKQPNYYVHRPCDPPSQLSYRQVERGAILDNVSDVLTGICVHTGYFEEQGSELSWTKLPLCDTSFQSVPALSVGPDSNHFPASVCCEYSARQWPPRYRKMSQDITGFGSSPLCRMNVRIARSP